MNKLIKSHEDKGAISIPFTLPVYFTGYEVFHIIAQGDKQFTQPTPPKNINAEDSKLVIEE